MLEEVTGKKHPRDKPLDTSRIASIRMGTTVCATFHALHHIDLHASSNVYSEVLCDQPQCFNLARRQQLPLTLAAGASF